MANIVYVSCHSVLEQQELTLFTELNHDCFSLGAYHRPEGHVGLPRPGVAGLKYHEDLDNIYLNNPNRNDIHPDIISWADMFVFMHSPDSLVCNWPKIKNKKVVFRSIGQSLPHIEQMLSPLVNDGLKIVRYSPKENKLTNFAGSNSMIRFCVDKDELQGWNGNDPSVINFTQSLKGRRIFCHYDDIVSMMSGYPSKVFGSGNEDLGILNGGELPWELMKGKLRDARVFVYGGTWPASYTMSFQEAAMTGIPIVSIGKGMAENLPGIDKIDFFEIPELFKNGKEIFYAEDMGTLRSHIFNLLNNIELAREMSDNLRKRAIQLFDKNMIREQWRDFFDKGWK